MKERLLLKEDIASLVAPIKDYLLKTYNDKIKEILLYGSQAREESTADSDVDLLVVIDDELDRFAVRKSLSDILWDILMSSGELISVIVVPHSYYANYKSPFIFNVKEEGISIV